MTSHSWLLLTNCKTWIMTLRSSDLQSDSDLDSIRNSCDVYCTIVHTSSHTNWHVHFWLCREQFILYTGWALDDWEGVNKTFLYSPLPLNEWMESHHWYQWFYDGFWTTKPLVAMFFQWFPMAANHWSDDGMVTIHHSGLALTFKIFLIFQRYGNKLGDPVSVKPELLIKCKLHNILIINYKYYFLLICYQCNALMMPSLTTQMF